MLGATPREFESRILRHADQPERAADRYRRPRVVVPATVGRYGPTGWLRRLERGSASTYGRRSGETTSGSGPRLTEHNTGHLPTVPRWQVDPLPAQAHDLRHRSARPRQNTPRRTLCCSRYRAAQVLLQTWSRTKDQRGGSDRRTRWCGRPCRPGVRVPACPCDGFRGRRQAVCGPCCSCVGEARPGDGCRVRQ